MRRTARRGREAGPVGAQTAQPQAGRINEICGFADGAAQAPLRLRDHRRKQFTEHRAGAQGVGVGQARARYRCSDVIKPPNMFVGIVRAKQTLELTPRDLPQQIVENAIVVPLGVDTDFVSRRRAKRLDTSRINTVRSV